MKMQRSHCENENVQFVQELAEVDGPFESPININFRDLAKLELPSLVWNNCEIAPKKMKITNTGHTVIISAKWKCERPYLTGGPLSGKYVFSQIHFHWGQDDCKGSEHHVSGEGFPLEMHVAHFKAEYATQENALREKDGMVVVVYLFKLQDEPNAALKKIISCLSNVKQASTSQVIDPRPILSLCNPFMDDYFMYWGSVVTPTCAHILLWIVCREPFGISRDQVAEFRKLCDGTQQPICRNNRDPQPLHRRNVFHVNASKNLDEPLLPIKKMMGCYCKGSEESVRMKSQANGSNQPHLRNQEDIEGNITKNKTGYGVRNSGGSRGRVSKITLPQSFYVRQTFKVHRAAVKSVPQLSTWCGNEIIPRCSKKYLNRTKSETDTNLKSCSQNCCFLPYKEAQKMKIVEGKRKIKNKKTPLASLKALSHIMDSLEALKNHTVRKLKEIESINQEIKGMKPFCQDSEDKRWLKNVEKMMSRQKRFTLKASKTCLGELKKLAKESTFNKLYDNPTLPVENTEIVQQEVIEQALPCSEACVEKPHEENVSVDKTSSKPLLIEKDVKLSAKAQKLIQSFFEDIKESEELQQTVRRDIELKKISSIDAKKEQGDDSTAVTNVTKGLITQKMFNLGNLGDRFFAEVTSEELQPVQPEDNGWGDKVASNGLVVFEDEVEPKKSVTNGEESDKDANTNVEEVEVCSELSNNADETIPLHRANVTTTLSQPTEKPKEIKDSLLLYKNLVNEKETELQILEGLSDTESTSCSESFYTYKKSNKKDYLNKSIDAYFRKQLDAVANYKLPKHLKTDDLLLSLQKSSSNISTDSTDTQRMIIAKLNKRQSSKDIWQKKSSTPRKVSSKALYGKTSWRKLQNKLRNINVEGYYLRKKNLRHKRKKGLKIEGAIKGAPSSFEKSSTSRDELKTLMRKSKWKSLAKTKFKLEIKKSSDSTVDSEIEYSFLSPERKKPKVECKKVKEDTHRSKTLTEKAQMYFDDDDPSTFNIPKKSDNKSKNQENVDLYILKGNDDYGEEEHENGVDNVKKSSVHTPEIHSRVLTRIHIPRSSANETRANSRESMKKPTRANSAESRSTSSEIPESNKPNTNDSPRVLNTENIKFMIVKNRSLTSLTARSKDRCWEINQRVFVESIDLRMNGREGFEQKIKPESPKQEISSKVVTPRTVSRGTSNENIRKIEKEVTQEIPIQEFNIEFFTSTIEPSNISPQQEKIDKNPPLKRCDTEKYYFLEKVLDENIADGQDNIIFEEKSRPESVQSESNRSYKPDGLNMKGDAVISTGDNKELKTSVSYMAQKKNPQSRSHSVESLGSIKKVCRRKGKKRPHCCKRNSRHYIKRNSSSYKKINKSDNKTINFFGLTEEEQLKIISVNVAKYLEQKLVEVKNKYDPNDEGFDLKDDCFDPKDETFDLKEECFDPKDESFDPKDESFDLKDETFDPKDETFDPKDESFDPKDETFDPKVESFDPKDESFEPKEECLDLKEELKPKETKIAVKKVKASEEKPLSPPVVEIKKEEIPNAKTVEKGVVKKEKIAEPEHSKGETIKEIKLEDTSKEKRSASTASPRPVHNFIKLNKLMAGKYKRSTTPVEKVPPDSSKPKTIELPPEESFTPKPKLTRKKKDKTYLTKRIDQSKGDKNATADQKVANKTNSGKANQKKSSTAIKKKGSEQSKIPSKKASPPAEKKVKKKQEEKPEEEEDTKEPPPASLVLQKISQAKNRRIPAYMVTSYLPAPIEIVEKQQQKMNRYLLNMNASNMKEYLTDVLNESQGKNKKNKNGDSMLSKELEYLIRLQMCMNNDKSTNMENSMNYIKTLLGQDCNGPFIDIPTESLDFYEPRKKGVVLTEMNEGLDCSSTNSDYTEDSEKYSPAQGPTNGKQKSKAKSYVSSTTANESGDSQMIDSTLMHGYDIPEEWNSDAGYNCEISITLNTSSIDGEHDLNFHDPTASKNSICELGGDSGYNLTQNQTLQSCSPVSKKPHRKKRKENEISTEMKQKLLEILEEEIKREMEASYFVQSENSSDTMTWKWEDADIIRRSQSTDSSSENVEVLTQISETMRQYLTKFIEKKIAAKQDKPLDEERKSEDMS